MSDKEFLLPGKGNFLAYLTMQLFDVLTPFKRPDMRGFYKTGSSCPLYTALFRAHTTKEKDELSKIKAPLKYLYSNAIMYSAIT